MIRLKDWLSRNLIATAAVALLVLTLAITVVVPLLNRPGDRPDPQEQIGLAWIKPVGSEAAYAGSEACKSCHPKEYESYIASPHSHAVHLIPAGKELPEFDSHQTITDDRNNIIYSVQKGGGKNQIVATAGSHTELGEARWVFGSGTQAWTYLSQDDQKFIQLRISYYPPSKTWNFTPGSGPGAPYHEPLGDPYTPGQAAACFGCHSTVITGTRKKLDFDHSILTVGCESCHGPSRSHIESVQGGGASGATGQAAIIKPPSHDGPQTMQLCGACHRVPVAVKDENASASPQLARFPGVALPRSRCFTESSGKLSCVTCHNPHQSTVQQTEASFDQKCINCHSKPHGTTCSNGQTSACVSCHMPVETIARKLPLRFHNHWIRKDPGALN